MPKSDLTQGWVRSQGYVDVCRKDNKCVEPLVNKQNKFYRVMMIIMKTNRVKKVNKQIGMIYMGKMIHKLRMIYKLRMI